MGAVVGGLIVGIVENLAAGYLDPYVGGGTKDFAPYVLMIAASDDPARRHLRPAPHRARMMQLSPRLAPRSAGTPPHRRCAGGEAQHACAKRAHCWRGGTQPQRGRWVRRDVPPRDPGSSRPAMPPIWRSTRCRSRKWAVAAFAGLFIVIAPLDARRILHLDPQPDPDRRRRRARPQHPGRLHRADLDRPWRLHVGRRLHRGQPRRPSRRAVLGHDPGGRADGGADRRGGRHPVVAHQGHLSRDRDAGRAADHRVDDQSRAGDLGRRAGLDPGAAPELFGTPAQDARRSSISF